MDDLHNDTSARGEAGGAAASVAEPQENLSIHSTVKAPVRRGGRGRKASPELTRAVHDVRASEERIKHDITRLNGDKERLMEQVSDLEERLEAAKKEGLLKSTIKRLEALLTEAHDKLNILEGVLPEQSISRDRALMEEVLKKWHEYDHERTNQAKAESIINKTPEDTRAEGDFNRARAAAHALKEEIGALVKQGELVVENSTPSPVRDEWVSYTREQAKKEAEEFTKKHTQNTETAGDPVIVEEEAESEEEPSNEPTPDQPNIEYRISNIEGDKDTSPVSVPHFDIPLNPQVPAPDLVKSPTGKLQHSTFDSVQDANLLIRQYSAPTPDIHPATIDTDIHPLITEDQPMAAEPEVPDNDYIAKAEAGDAAWDLAQQQIKELYEKTHTAEPEEQAPLIVPEEVGVETKNETNIETPAEKEVVAEAIIEQPSPEILEKKIEASSEVVSKEIPEVAPVAPVADPQTLAYAEKQIHNHINTLFEKKGFLGFGATMGTDSPDWKDPQIGFANKAVEEIMRIKTETLPRDGKKHFGIEEPVATDKMQKYLQLALQETGVEPLPGEKAENYLTRASSIAIGKFLKKV